MFDIVEWFEEWLSDIIMVGVLQPLDHDVAAVALLDALQLKTRVIGHAGSGSDRPKL